MTPQAGPPVIVSIDQGTTNTKAIAVDQDGRVRATGSAPVGVSFPQPGWVEQDAELIWNSVQTAVSRCVADGAHDIAGVALSTQRESVLGLASEHGYADRSGAGLAGSADGRVVFDDHQRRTPRRWSATAPACGSTPCSRRRRSDGC